MPFDHLAAELVNGLHALVAHLAHTDHVGVCGTLGSRCDLGVGTGLVGFVKSVHPDEAPSSAPEGAAAVEATPQQHNGFFGSARPCGRVVACGAVAEKRESGPRSRQASSWTRFL
mmetsp:Transcript_105971/g.269171  ORF Transcript_105971/g.269171 Transcript_105971/m.269171 type:complete len:115 (-) Transcript_105971:97-441(-)